MVVAFVVVGSVVVDFVVVGSVVVVSVCTAHVLQQVTSRVLAV